MRVLCSAVPALGHVLPLMSLASAAQDAGHDVLFGTHPDCHAPIVAAGLAPVAVGMSGSEMVSERLLRWPETANQPAHVWSGRMWTEIMAPTTLADLAIVIKAFQPAVAVHD